MADDNKVHKLQPRFFKVWLKDNILYFKHIHEGVQSRGTATFNLTTRKSTINGSVKENLKYFFRNYYVFNKPSWWGVRTRAMYNMTNDLSFIEDKKFSNFLIADCIKRFHYFTGSGASNLGTILLEVYRFENYRLWKEQGYFIERLVSISPKDIPKDIRKIIKESNIEIDVFNNTSEGRQKLYCDLVNSFVIEKIPKGVDRRWRRDPTDPTKSDTFDVYMTWEKIIREASYFVDLLRYGYTIKAILRYLFNYLTIYENLSIRDGLRYLRDYAKLNVDMKIETYKRFPKYLKSQHDILSAEFVNYKKEYDEMRFREKVKQELAFECKEFVVLVPQCTKDIRDEGKHLNHCVGSYITRVIEGKTQILFLRTNPKYSLVTLEVRDNVLIQAKGLSNRATFKEENKFIKKYAKEKRLLVRI